MKSNKKILFLARLFIPHIGGVEKQVFELSKRLVKRGYKVKVITEKYDSSLKNKEIVDGVEIVRFNKLPVKYFGLLSIWIWFLFHLKYLRNADLVHAHSVYIWYWPFKLLFPRKPNFVTFHGWEGIYPIPFKNKIIRKIDTLLSNKNITISDYVEKHYGIKADVLMYTSVNVNTNTANGLVKSKNSLLYVGRLDEDTGLRKILKCLSFLKKTKIHVEFCGDGPLKKDCMKYGKVRGFVDPTEYYKKSFICLSPGHTSILEAFTYKCLIVTTYNNPVKKDYLLMTPFRRWIVVRNSPKKLAEEIKYFLKHPEKAKALTVPAYEWVKTQNWDEGVKTYIKLWEIEK